MGQSFTSFILAISVNALFTPFYPNVTDHDSRKDFVIAIDIGHASTRPGAISARGVNEHVFNQNLAELILAGLRKANFVNSFLINGEGDDTPLIERAEIAKNKKSKLLISIHHDSVQPIYLKPWAYKGKQHFYSNRYRGFSLFYSEKNAAPLQSSKLALYIGKELLTKGLTPSPHHAEPIEGENRDLVDREHGIYIFDDLIILKTSEMPAVLIEAGIIVNQNEEVLLGQPEYQGKIVAAIVAGIENFFEENRGKPDKDQNTRKEGS